MEITFGPASGFIEYALEKLANIRTQHRLSNILIELDGANYARSESYVHAHHEADTRFGGEHFIVGARYLDLFEKRDGQWRIRERTLVLDYCSRMAATDVPGTGYFRNARIQGSKYPGDPVYGVGLPRS
jgi:hypothetical protein